jgi:hypothetical protein
MSTPTDSLCGGTNHPSTTVRAVPRLQLGPCLACNWVVLHASMTTASTAQTRRALKRRTSSECKPSRAALRCADFWHEPYMGMDLNDWEQASPNAYDTVR